ncbi:MAG: flagellar motor switch protein FliN [Thermodesulfobacteriota bacterium]|nr:flagellar motor switch protein FliN [Thermodesulfobacteriota bacterium]
MAKDDPTMKTIASGAGNGTQLPPAATDISERPSDQSVAEQTRTAPGLAGQQTLEQSYSFSDLDKASAPDSEKNIDFILDIPLEVVVELGRTRMLINDLLRLGQGSVVQLSKLAGETLDILANQKLIARGEVVVVDEKYGIRLTEIVTPTERIESLK